MLFLSVGQLLRVNSLSRLSRDPGFCPSQSPSVLCTELESLGFFSMAWNRSLVKLCNNVFLRHGESWGHHSCIKHGFIFIVLHNPLGIRSIISQTANSLLASLIKISPLSYGFLWGSISALRHPAHSWNTNPVNSQCTHIETINILKINEFWGR